MGTKVEITIPDTPKVGDAVHGTVTAVDAAPPVTPPVDPPPVSGQPPGTILIDGGPLMPNTGNRQFMMQVNTDGNGPLYAIQMGADARDAGFACPAGTCTTLPQNSPVSPAQGMDAAVVFGALKKGDWLVMYIGPNHTPNGAALISAHAN